MVSGPIISLHMLLGAIVGWGVLSPLARAKGWATGHVGDWDTGSRAWIVWIGLATLLADSLVKLGWPFIAAARAKFNRASSSTAGFAVIGSSGDEPETSHQPRTPTDQWMVTLLSLLAASLFCVLASTIVFGFMPRHVLVLSVALTLPLSIMGIRAVAETDVNPIAGIGKVAQLIFAVVVPPSNSHVILINLVAGSIAEAGANQAGDLAFDLKIGHLVGAKAWVQLYGQIIGCIAGSFMACGLYKLYTVVYTIPDKRFQIPVGYMAIIAARLVTGKGLPDGALEFVTAFGIFFSITTVIKMRYAEHRWQNILPSGVAFAVGIYTTPSFSLARMIGGLLSWYCRTYREGSYSLMAVFASGLILGEGLCSIIILFLP
ncbi:OPT oligopeptide transporter protein-domain-containing protein [Ilyonectria robusta]|uniref:OPT oligopeptide transporter protein-domain-containing protein n=1 Tax=Ilyonectria robusta TaxID=1079257 RepID=UPI001E8E8CAD|nr:OPT oligopeptide transporter protein-domain-containing protein [Ilyonectria robusta]KAH8648116.1 OPT oligopeptide transporter protein-domain-containing protein [Ilyonectria robusta]